MTTGCLRRILAGVLMACLAVSGIASAGDTGSGAYKLEGAWIAKVPGTAGQWTYVMVPDPSGKTAAGHGSIDVGFVLSPELVADYQSPLLIQAVMTGPKTAVSTSVWYGIRRLSSPGPNGENAEVVYIGTSHGTTTYVAPGKAVGLHALSFYLPTADADGDGLPDAGATPVAYVELPTEETRLPAPF